LRNRNSRDAQRRTTEPGGSPQEDSMGTQHASDEAQYQRRNQLDMDVSNADALVIAAASVYIRAIEDGLTGDRLVAYIDNLHEAVRAQRDAIKARREGWRK